MGGAEWHQRAVAAEQRQDWEEAIGLVAGHAECHGADHYRHNSHLWHMRLLAVAGRWSELDLLGRDDRHAVRALNTHLHEIGRADLLRRRADDGDRHALTHLVRLLAETGGLAVMFGEVVQPGDR